MQHQLVTGKLAKAGLDNRVNWLREQSSQELKPTERFKPFLILDIDARRNKYGGDIFPRMPEPPFKSDHVRIWQTDKYGNAKGIIRITLREQEENDQE